MDISYLKNCDLARLEELYLQKVDIAIPQSGAYQGTYLKRLDNPGANNSFNVVLQWAMFDLTPFGLNFFSDHGDWYFFHPSLAMGKFIPRRERSRWRDTETITLNYETSRLPKPIRSMLYDEIRPLSENIMLGIGGLNADKDKGDLFFFAIERIKY